MRCAELLLMRCGVTHMARLCRAVSSRFASGVLELIFMLMCFLQFRKSKR